MNKKALYESIMKNVAKQVKKALDESAKNGVAYELEDDEYEKLVVRLVIRIKQCRLAIKEEMSSNEGLKNWFNLLREIQYIIRYKKSSARAEGELWDEYPGAYIVYIGLGGDETISDLDKEELQDLADEITRKLGTMYMFTLR